MRRIESGSTAAHLSRRVRAAVVARFLRRLPTGYVEMPPMEVTARWQRYLLVVLAELGTVAIEADDLPLVMRVLPLSRVLTRVRLKRADKPAEVVVSRTPVPGRRTIRIDLDYFRALPDGALRLPYFAHPNVYESRLYECFEQLRDTPKKHRVVFAGTVGEAYAGRQYRFPGLNRMDVLDSVRAAFPDQIDIVHSAAQADAAERPIVLSVTQRGGDTLEKHALPQADYLRFLASGWTMLAPPGFKMPFSHNVVEALAVGVTPILNYGELFDPPLRDGSSCFGFLTVRDLVETIRLALMLPTDELRRRQAATSAFYAVWLGPEGFAKRLGRALHEATDSVHVLVNGEDASTPYYWRRLDWPRAS